VTPFRKRGRKAGTRGNRGGKAYLPRPSLVTRDYGSDFDSGSGGESDVEPELVEDEELDVESEDDLIPDVVSEAETDIIDDDGCSDGFSIHSGGGTVGSSKNRQSVAPTPLPYWLKSDEDLPQLELPESSEDLLLPSHQVLPACAIYEVLRKFSSEVNILNIY
jgi:nucleosome-remodeling factor subunit BPTF